MPADERRAYRTAGVERLVVAVTDRLLRAIGTGDTKTALQLLGVDEARVVVCLAGTGLASDPFSRGRCPFGHAVEWFSEIKEALTEQAEDWTETRRTLQDGGDTEDQVVLFPVAPFTQGGTGRGVERDLSDRRPAFPSPSGQKVSG